MTDDLAEEQGWAHYIEESRRFDYYVIGANGVALGYALQALSRIASRVDYLVPASWLLLLISLGAGVAHLRAKVKIYRASAQQRNVLASLNRDIQAQMKGESVYHVPTDIPLSGQKLEEVIDMLRETRDHNEKYIERADHQAAIIQWVRDIALIGGVAVFAAWRFCNLLGVS